MARGRHAERRELDLRIRSRAAIRVLLAVLLIVPLVGYNALGIAGAAPGSVTTFSIDGNTAAPNDWDDSTSGDPYHVASVADKCDDTADDSLVPSTKLDDPWLVEAHKANSKGDICRVWTGWERRPDGHVIMLFGWQRLENTGEVTVYVPLEGPAAGRGDDLLIKFEYDSDVKLIEVSMLAWNGSSWGNEVSLNPSLAEYAVSGDTRFAEIALDLTGSGILPENQCKSFVGAKVLTETGQAEANPTLKDYVDISTGTFTFNSCGTVIIRKHTEPREGLAGPFSAYLTGLGAPSIEAVLEEGGDSVPFVDLELGTYTVSEDDPTEVGFSLTSIICEQDGEAVPATFDVLANSQTTCVITNTELPEPGLSLVKSANPGVYDTVGQVISYSYVLTNSGNVTLSRPFSITDDKATDEACPGTPETLDPGESITCTASYTITQADLNAGSVTNVATGYAWYGEGQVPSNPDDETVDALQTGPTLLLDKSAAPSTYGAVGQVISYEYVLKNIGNVTLYDPFSISDDKVTDEACPGTPETLDPGESITCTASYTITQADLNAGSVTNVATGYAWYGEGQVPSNPDDETVDAVRTAAILLDKSAVPSTYSAVGQAISYSYLLRNTGNVTLYGPFSITDDKATAVCPDTPVSLAPGESITCSASYTITQADLNLGSVTNVARGQGYDGAENPVESNEDTTTVVRPSPPNGNGPTPSASIGDLVWSDLDADGYQSDFEPGFPGVTVILLNSSGVTIDSRVTDASGKYLFTGLSAGTYFVQFGLPAGYRFSPLANGPSDTLDSDAGVGGRTVPIALSAGAVDLSWDAGIFREERVLPQVLTTASPSVETLPFTGGSDGAAAGMAVAIAALGGLLILAARRREDETVIVADDWYDRLRHYDPKY